MGNRFTEWLVLAGMLIGLPAIGVMLAGEPLGLYLEFPPETRFIHHAPFSWPAFAAYTVFVLAVAVPICIRLWTGSRRVTGPGKERYPFPWWGWMGLVSGAVFWILAWTRMPWFSDLQSHTFFPLWLSYIVVMNALGMRRDGRCLMVNQPGFFLLLFPFSAAFWWFFEYLNRFVQNWYYTGVHFGPGAYFLLATLSFSTVLPAVLSTQEWIGGASTINAGFRSVLPIRPAKPRALAMVTIVCAAAGLLLIGVLPNLLFPLVWVAPLLILSSVRGLLGKRQVFSEIAGGDWRPVMSAALAALLCGLFWEMWNFFSLARWEYSVPLVQRFHIFEMPILGYAGYLPFGLECLAVCQLVAELRRPNIA
ncbi:hypothetical protein D3OALGA1CA_323 [Olavius algarvensis associated proteobacterium Delta 3]|nr:hypothetical protein D3OALGA1CA_323 [Olavius algarvensis associated proteobacterium Delta 3]